MRLSSFHEHVNAIEQLPRSTSITDQRSTSSSTSITDQLTTSNTDRMTTSNTDQTTTLQRLQDDISDTIKAISIQLSTIFLQLNSVYLLPLQYP
jgi:hypothetical protein